VSTVFTFSGIDEQDNNNANANDNDNENFNDNDNNDLRKDITPSLIGRAGVGLFYREGGRRVFL
jgi:hypothetical protein